MDVCRRNRDKEKDMISRGGGGGGSGWRDGGRDRGRDDELDVELGGGGGLYISVSQLFDVIASVGLRMSAAEVEVRLI